MNTKQTKKIEYNKSLDKKTEEEYNKLYPYDLFETLANNLRPY